jgi:hypothetical protein
MPGSQGELMATSLEEFSIEQVQNPRRTKLFHQGAPIFLLNERSRNKFSASG